MKKKIALFSLLAGSLLLGGCSDAHQITADPSASTYGTLQISRGFSDETEQIATIYAHALRQAGYTVELVDTGDSRASYLEAMGSNRESSTETSTPEASNDPATVDLAIDYSGNLLLYLTDDATKSPSSIEQARSASASPTADLPSDVALTETASPSQAPTSTSPSPTPTGYNVNALSENDILNAINQALPGNLSTLNAANAENRDALVVTRATAEQYGLSSIKDLTEHCSSLTFGGPQAFEERSYGLKALNERYDCTPQKFVVEEDQATLSRLLANNTVQVADIYSASSDIDNNDYVVLGDPDSTFIPQQIVPVIADAELPDTAKDTINSVTSKLSTSDLKLFNQLTSGDNAISKDDVAEFWLEQTTE